VNNAKNGIGEHKNRHTIQNQQSQNDLSSPFNQAAIKANGSGESYFNHQSGVSNSYRWGPANDPHNYEG